MAPLICYAADRHECRHPRNEALSKANDFAPAPCKAIMQGIINLEARGNAAGYLGFDAAASPTTGAGAGPDGPTISETGAAYPRPLSKGQGCPACPR